MGTDQAPDHLQHLDVVVDTEEYRDSIATVDKDGKRVWLYPKKPSGRFYNARALVSFIFLALFLIIPFIKVDGEQFLQFNVLERRFVLFGLLFTPQDFHLFGLAMLTMVVFIILFTVVYGRLFCGWVCPQTVFMEMFFRRIEYWIEGDAGEQRKLNQGPWTKEKIRKKTIKNIVFFAIAVVVSNYFLAYIIGMDEVLKIVSEPIGKHTGGFVAMLVFSFLFFGVFSRLREQVCTTICPYGRLQGVLLVKDSIVVAYDHKRGEPRGKMKKSKAAEAKTDSAALSESAAANPVDQIKAAVHGDCIDCKLCIAVCPTGIDIRNGTQLECTNCTACIDACDGIMDKVSKPRGLIRYDSMAGIEAGKRKIFTPRVWAYSFVLFALLTLDVILLTNRGQVETIILRSPGQLFQQKEDGHITNLYTYKIINKSNKEFPLSIQPVTPGAKIQFVGASLTTIPKGGRVEGVFFLEMPNENLTGRKTQILIDVYSNDKKIDAVKTNFLGPSSHQ
ncbi:MAG: cytochrome c oxidase accessory protein CcoG [Chitinophagales bacterium]|nr:cytochrome c oxidase accessory protein CcoG [Chitinophagales bacterium]